MTTASSAAGFQLRQTAWAKQALMPATGLKEVATLNLSKLNSKLGLDLPFDQLA
jgi:phage terminase small subunit